ncbi:hypothetical protein [Prevotella sp. kh1p2]|uniref:hypothetical protein n=1 Tax=Prevotella sp. kh1p2 TaxID=1761883 RepID=UPI0008CEF635|nr:hypothetical protein [Prevotella sp. kh1p2]SES62474.1 hypothetical protein SAMN04487825_10127 [Prevotella sp. kh1p2]SNU10227.1 hypothetical protein SAMN06298210_101259 [Prevotellaceae bacterium KH2P17]
MKINVILLSLGLLCIICFSMIAYFIMTDWDVRVNGQLVNAEVVAIEGRVSRPVGSATVRIGNQFYDAGSIDSSVSIGDSILVRYSAKDQSVIQEKVNPHLYIFYMFLDMLLILPGVLLIKESFKGRKLWEYL